MRSLTPFSYPGGVNCSINFQFVAHLRKLESLRYIYQTHVSVVILLELGPLFNYFRYACLSHRYVLPINWRR